MAFEVVNGPDDESLPNVAVPGIHIAAVNRLMDKFDAHVNKLGNKVQANLDQRLSQIEDGLNAIVEKIATPIVTALEAADNHLEQMGTLIRNDLNARMDVAEANMPGVGQETLATRAAAVPAHTPAATSAPGTIQPSFFMRVPEKVAAAAIVVNQPTGAPPVQAGGRCAAVPLTQVVFQQANELAINVFQRTPPTAGERPQQWIIWLTDQCCVVAQTVDDYEASSGFNHDNPILPGGMGTKAQAEATVKALSVYLQTQNFPQCQLGQPPGQIIVTPILPVEPPPPPPCPDQPCSINLTCPPCPPPTLPVFPTCIQIDLCDWEKLCDTLRKCFTRTPEQQAADCSLDNASAWAYDNCDGTFATDLQSYLGDQVGSIETAPTLADLAAQGISGASALSFDDFPSLPPLIV